MDIRVRAELGLRTCQPNLPVMKRLMNCCAWPAFQPRIRRRGVGLRAPCGALEPGLAATGARRVPQPSPAQHNAPLDKIERASDRLIAALGELRRHPHAHGSFWRSNAFGPVYASEFERAGVVPTLTKIRDAAREARVSKTGRPRDFRKQQIVDMALAFCARFSPSRPSSDTNNFFPRFAERFFEYSTGLAVDDKGQGIGRQIRAALRRLPS